MTTLLSRSPIPPDPGSRSSSRRFMVSPALSDQQSQLDDIISDLLSDKAFMTDHGEINPLDMNGIVMPQHGSITTQTGNGRTVLSWQTHQSGPNKSPSGSRPGSRAGSRPASRASSRPSSRGARVESDSLFNNRPQSSTREQSSTVQNLPGGGISKTSSKYEENRWATKDGYHHRTSKETKSFEERRSTGLDKQISMINSASSGEMNSRSPPPPPVRRRIFSPDQLGTSTFDSRQGPPHRKEPFDSVPKRAASETRQYSSDTEDALASSWLETQRTKLYEKRDSRTESEQIMSRSSGYSSTNRSYVAHSDSEDRRDDGPPPARPPPPISSYDSLDELSNLLTESSRDLASSSFRQQQRSQKHYQVQQPQRSSSVGTMRPGNSTAADIEPVFFVSGLEKPAFSKQQTKYVFSVSPSPTSMLKDDSLEDKFNRASALSPPPPKRGDSSKEAVMRRNEPTRAAPSVDELDAALAKIMADSKPEPEEERMIEEEIISLEPIGRGIHTLEPDLATLSRNRSRAVSPVYPGFPTPGYRSPSLGRMQGGGVSPTPSRARSVTPAPQSGRTLTPTPYVTSSRISETISSSSQKADQSLSKETTRVQDQKNYEGAGGKAQIAPQPQEPVVPLIPLSPQVSQAAGGRQTSKEEDLERALNAMMVNTEPFKKSNVPQKDAAPNQVVTEPVLKAVESSRAEQLQKVPEQLATLTRTTITKTQTQTQPAYNGYNDLRSTTPCSQQQQQQHQQHNSSHAGQQQSVLTQQQQLLEHSQQLQLLEQQQKALREKQQQLQKEQQELLQQQRLKQQQASNAAAGGRKWIVKEETVTNTYRSSGGQTGQTGVQTGQDGGLTGQAGAIVSNTYKSSGSQQAQHVEARGSSAVTSSPETGHHHHHQLQLQQIKQTGRVQDEDLEKQMLEIEKLMQQDNERLAQSSSSQQYSSVKQQSSMAQQQQITGVQASSAEQQKSATVQQLNDLSHKLKQLHQQQQAESSTEHVYSTVSHQQRQQAISSAYTAKQQNQSMSLAGTGGVSVQSASSRAGLSAASQQQQEEGNQEQHYATVPSREARQAALSVESASANTEAGNTGTIGRSPSPSLWTTEALRSYTERKHSGSVSPLLPPSSTLLTCGRSSPYFAQSTGSMSSMNGNFGPIGGEADTLNHIQKFVRDSSRLWHRPNITREEAISLLRDKPPGSFIVRNSSTFQGAYGMALKVAQVPPNVQSKGGDPQTELVRHFLIEPTSKGVRLKGCSNEPVFQSLAALVYQHTITPLALPCKLMLPEDTEVKFVDVTDSSSGVLTQGAACSVLYLNSVDTESLTGTTALSKTIRETFRDNRRPKTTLVEFKVSTQGITLTDNQRSLFFRRHYPMSTVTYCGIDEGERRWNPSNEVPNISVGGRVFGFVARKHGSLAENTCHIFVEADPNQPASAIVDFITKIMIRHGQSMKIS